MKTRTWALKFLIKYGGLKYDVANDVLNNIERSVLKQDFDKLIDLLDNMCYNSRLKDR